VSRKRRTNTGILTPIWIWLFRLVSFLDSLEAQGLVAFKHFGVTNAFDNLTKAVLPLSRKIRLQIKCRVSSQSQGPPYSSSMGLLVLKISKSLGSYLLASC
jgi:hypothetical protein